MTKPVKNKIRTGRGSVALIALMFLGSAGMRIALSTDAAFAKTANTENESTQPKTQSTTNSPQSESRTVPALLDALIKREEKVKETEERQALRAESLEKAKKEIESKLVQLEALEERLSKTLAQARGAEEKDLARLTTVYESMKPAEAAALFEAMEASFAAGFLGRMRPDSAAAIMAGLDPQKAYTISVLLAGRNGKVPKN
ncbi:hypothetical protein ASD8599_00086 [Ascidiaceihabitans donghaensis]|uniref:Magnesium transporter MgtE intracellular domain-containing protein n=1 Tax=Ascidiaceihabitans donghaensis TaxID=1510460 RepID=A0A2R8B8I6_9RHOB|nr:hypothetical protein [Ascidiaceihabitans donghaensis]SPH19361.1 hypothetical protein ASD8599_00086 [Ascidiaceihabitans donghaensis]